MVAAIRRAMMTHRKFFVVALLLPARKGRLVEGKGFPGDWGSEGSQMAKRWPDEFTESNPLTRMHRSRTKCRSSRTAAVSLFLTKALKTLLKLNGAHGGYQANRLL